MLQMLCDLFRHSAWADAEQLRAAGVHAVSREDGEIRRRLFHAHYARSCYLAFIRGLLEEGESPEPPGSFTGLRQIIQEGYKRAGQILAGITEDRLRVSLLFGETGDADRGTVAEVLLQAVMHSHYHRGQSAARLRELGAEPPVTEYLAWVRSGRPAPAW